MSWTDGALGDFLTLKRGHDLPNGDRKVGEIPVVSSSGFTGWHNEAKAEPPGVVTGRYGTIGEVFYVDQPYWPLNTALYVVDFKGNDPKFVAYFLREKLKNYQSEKAAVPGVDRKVLHKIPAQFPDKQIQRTIVNIISAYDNLLDNNRRRVALLEVAGRQLYKEWFVRFRFPGNEHVKIIDGVPEGWRMLTYGDVFDFLGGYAFKSSTYTEDGKFGVVTIKNVHDGQFVTECRSRVSDVPQTMKSHCNLKAGDVLLSLTGNVGRACVVIGEHLLLNQRVAKVVGKADIPGSYTYWTFSNAERQRELENMAYGVAQLNLSPVKLAARPFALPPIALLEGFAAFAEPVLAQIIKLNQGLVEIAKARDFLLPRLMSGAIVV